MMKRITSALTSLAMVMLTCIPARAKRPQSDSTRRRRQSGSLLLKALLPVVVLLALPGSSLAQSALTDDAHISLSQGNANHGASPNLNVSSGENIYLKFKLSNLPAATPGSAVERATLKLYVGGVKTAGKLDVYSALGDWDESAITGNNAPPLGDLVATSSQVGTDQKGKFFVIDITPLVQQWLGTDGQGTGGIPNHGLALVAHSIDATTPEVADITFDSKENSQTSHEPQLNIHLESAAGGLQKVEHDATLAGDGTSTSPLGVANGGVNTVHLANDAVTGDKIASNAVNSSEIADGAVTSPKIGVPLSLVSADPNFTLSVGNIGSGAAITANGAINTTTQYNIGGARILSNAGNSNLFVGINAGAANTTGAGNVFVGPGAGGSNTSGFSNSFFGVLAGRLNTTGGQNTFFGLSAGFANTTQCCNSYFGFQAGGSATGTSNSFFGQGAGLQSTGSSNAFFGNGAGNQNTSGSENSFFGTGAGQSNTTAIFNSFFGASAGISTTTGNNNSFFGWRAGRSNTTGFTNSFFGINAGRDNTTGVGNTFIGGIAGRDNTTGDSNSFFGVQAGFQNTTGDGNVFIGISAAAGNKAGSNNVVIGTFADVGADNLTNATAVGHRAQVAQSNSLVLGSINGVNFSGVDTNVGIGTTAPKTKLHLKSGKIYVEANGQGVILKSPGGSCFELTVTDAGALATTPIACP